MDIDVAGILFGGFSAVVLLVFLVQTARETFNINSQYLPVTGLVIALVMMLMAVYLPEKVVMALGGAIALAAVASFTIRYTKNGNSEDEQRARSATAHLQRDHLADERVGGQARKSTTHTFPEQ
jgi:hypothetical protein